MASKDGSEKRKRVNLRGYSSVSITGNPSPPDITFIISVH
jgi:hypothetical protein